MLALASQTNQLTSLQTEHAQNLPILLADLYGLEKQVCELTMTMFNRIHRLEKAMTETSNEALALTSVTLESIDINEVLSSFTAMRVEEGSPSVAPILLSLTENQRSSSPLLKQSEATVVTKEGTLMMSRDDGATTSKSRYLVFKEYDRLFSIFDKPDVKTIF